MDWLAPKSPREVKLQIFTFKQGMLSAVGHHLCFSAPATLSSSGLNQGIQLELAVCSQELRLLGSVDAPEMADLCSFDFDLSSVSEMTWQDERKIMKAALADVLDVERFPSIHWKGRVHGECPEVGLTLNGSLSLHGQEQPQTVEVRCASDGALAVAEIQPSRWGIPPYSAMLGALRLQDRVWVRALSGGSAA